MLKHLKLSGCAFTSSSLQCHPCPENRAGGFHPELGVLLCQDRLVNKKLMEDTIAHELIHAFDHCRFKLDWENLRHQACSEVRWCHPHHDHCLSTVLIADPRCQLEWRLPVGTRGPKRVLHIQQAASGAYLWGIGEVRNDLDQACVKRRAYLSVLGNPSCKSPDMAEKAVNEVWESCFKDTRPFDEVSKIVSLCLISTLIHDRSTRRESQSPVSISQHSTITPLAPIPSIGYASYIRQYLQMHTHIIVTLKP